MTEDGTTPLDPDERPATPVGALLDSLRAQPARFFSWLGSLIFAGGWGLTIYLVVSADNNSFVGGNTEARIQVLLSYGTLVTIAAGILWGVAAYIWIRLLPEEPDEH